MQIGQVNMKFKEPNKVALARLPLFLLDIEQALCNFNIIFKSISRTAVVSDIAVAVVKGRSLFIARWGAWGRRILGGIT